jgi:hypothetical protein
MGPVSGYILSQDRGSNDDRGPEDCTTEGGPQKSPTVAIVTIIGTAVSRISSSSDSITSVNSIGKVCIVSLVIGYVYRSLADQRFQHDTPQ